MNQPVIIICSSSNSRDINQMMTNSNIVNKGISIMTEEIVRTELRVHVIYLA